MNDEVNTTHEDSIASKKQRTVSPDTWSQEQRRWWCDVLDSYIAAAPRGQKQAVAKECEIMGTLAGIYVVQKDPNSQENGSA